MGKLSVTVVALDRDVKLVDDVGGADDVVLPGDTQWEVVEGEVEVKGGWKPGRLPPPYGSKGQDPEEDTSEPMLFELTDRPEIGRSELLEAARHAARSGRAAVVAIKR